MTQNQFEKYPYFIQAMANLKMMVVGAGLQDIKKIHYTKDSMRMEPYETPKKGESILKDTE